MAATQSVQCFGKKKTATAVAHCKVRHFLGIPGLTALTSAQAGKGLIKVNGSPLALVQPEILRFKVRSCKSARPENWKLGRHKARN